MIEVPGVREVIPQRGDVAVVVRSSLLFFLIGTSLVPQDLRDEGRVGLGCDKDGWHLQWWQWLPLAGHLFALVFLDLPCSGMGRRGGWGQW